MSFTLAVKCTSQEVAGLNPSLVFPWANSPSLSVLICKMNTPMLIPQRLLFEKQATMSLAPHFTWESKHLQELPSIMWHLGTYAFSWAASSALETFR